MDKELIWVESEIIFRIAGVSSDESTLIYKAKNIFYAKSFERYHEDIIIGDLPNNCREATLVEKGILKLRGKI